LPLRLCTVRRKAVKQGPAVIRPRLDPCLITAAAIGQLEQIERADVSPERTNRRPSVNRHLLHPSVHGGTVDKTTGNCTTVRAHWSGSPNLRFLPFAPLEIVSSCGKCFILAKRLSNDCAIDCRLWQVLRCASTAFCVGKSFLSCSISSRSG